jgi:hypothetical protein
MMEITFYATIYLLLKVMEKSSAVASEHGLRRKSLLE